MVMWIVNVLRRYARVIFVLTFILVSFLFLAQSPAKPASLSFQHADKVAHFGVFFVLAFTLHLAFRPKVWLGLLLLFMYGLLIEVAQSYVPGRGAEALDLVADMLGAATCYLLLYWRQNLGFFRR